MRLLPHFQETARRHPDEMLALDCKHCMSTTNRTTRQYMRCGYEPPAPEGMPSEAWLAESIELDEDEDDFPTTCAGYTVKLPEVIEVARARYHAEKTSLAAFCKSEPTEKLLYGIEVLDAAAQELERWRMKQPPEPR